MGESPTVGGNTKLSRQRDATALHICIQDDNLVLCHLNKFPLPFLAHFKMTQCAMRQLSTSRIL